VTRARQPSEGAHRVGVDFGTSNCLVAFAEREGPQAIALEDGESTLPSVVHVPRMPPPAASLVGTPLDAYEAMQRQSLSEALALGAQPRFGRAALAAAQDDPDGFFFRSPKSFLAADIDPVHRARFQRIVSLMLAHLRERASEAAGESLTQACFGRPVNFGSGSGRDPQQANDRALALLQAAARDAGWQEVIFEFEPVAAALDFERTLQRRQVALIVDIGGGTTDCTVALLGPADRGRATARADDRHEDILASVGDRVGGNDADTALAFAGLMPALGLGLRERSGLPVPPQPYSDAVDVFSVPAQAAFLRAGAAIAATCRRCDDAVAHQVRRLETLRESGQTLWLVTRAEAAKRALSESADPQVTVALERIEPGLRASLGAERLPRALEPLRLALQRLISEALAQAGARPEVIYLTGGSARAAALQEAVGQLLPGVPMVMGDAYGSVVAGLAMRAERAFGPRPAGRIRPAR
jgi:hypothetical chaperone protein